MAQILHEAKMGPLCIALMSWGKRDSDRRQREALETKHRSWSTAHAEKAPNIPRNLDTEPRFCQNLWSGLELGPLIPKNKCSEALSPLCLAVEKRNKNHLDGLPVDVCPQGARGEDSIGHRDGVGFGQVHVRLWDVELATSHLPETERDSICFIGLKRPLPSEKLTFFLEPRVKPGCSATGTDAESRF